MGWRRFDGFFLDGLGVVEVVEELHELFVVQDDGFEPDSEEALALLAGPARYHPTHTQAVARPDVAAGVRQSRDALERRAADAIRQRDEARVELESVRTLRDFDEERLRQAVRAFLVEWDKPINDMYVVVRNLRLALRATPTVPAPVAKP